jgi:hypothetical protein
MKNNNNDDDELCYVITDIEEFLYQTRKIIFAGFGQDTDEDNLNVKIQELGENDLEDLDKTLTQEECLAILHTHTKPKKTKTGKLKYIISDKMFNEIIEDINARLVSNLLQQLVSKGLVESTYDSEQNDFIFWLKEDNHQ